MQACHDAGVAVVARGRGTNTTGASVPLDRALVVSCERMVAIVASNAERYLSTELFAEV